MEKINNKYAVYMSKLFLISDFWTQNNTDIHRSYFGFGIAVSFRQPASSLSEKRLLDADLSDKRRYEAWFTKKSACIRVYPRPILVLLALSDRLLGSHQGAIANDLNALLAHPLTQIVPPKGFKFGSAGTPIGA